MLRVFILGLGILVAIRIPFTWQLDVWKWWGAYNDVHAWPELPQEGDSSGWPLTGKVAKWTSFKLSTQSNSAHPSGADVLIPVRTLCNISLLHVVWLLDTGVKVLKVCPKMYWLFESLVYNWQFFFYTGATLNLFPQWGQGLVRIHLSEALDSQYIWFLKGASQWLQPAQKGLPVLGLPCLLIVWEFQILHNIFFPLG